MYLYLREYDRGESVYMYEGLPNMWSIIKINDMAAMRRRFETSNQVRVRS